MIQKTFSAIHAQMNSTICPDIVVERELSTLLVTQILDSVYELIYTACPHMTTRRYPIGYMRSSRVYKPIYTVKNLCNNFIILQDFLFFKWNLVSFTVFSNVPKFLVWRLAINQNAKKASTMVLPLVFIDDLDPD